MNPFQNWKKQVCRKKVHFSKFDRHFRKSMDHFPFMDSSGGPQTTLVIGHPSSTHTTKSILTVIVSKW